MPPIAEEILHMERARAERAEQRAVELEERLRKLGG